jgi:signal transduction histidine kinase
MLWSGRNSKVKRRSFARFGFDPHLAAVAGDDTVTDCQTDARPVVVPAALFEDIENTVVSILGDAGAVVVDIADNGPGIPDSAKETIFAWGETRQSSDGGFGLYFVQTMLEYYGGGVEILDNEPEGAVFRVTLEAA